MNFRYILPHLRLLISMLNFIFTTLNSTLNVKLSQEAFKIVGLENLQKYVEETLFQVIFFSTSSF
jgi:hypothetical protein